VTIQTPDESDPVSDEDKEPVKPVQESGPNGDQIQDSSDALEVSSLVNAEAVVSDVSSASPAGSDSPPVDAGDDGKTEMERLLEESESLRDFNRGSVVEGVIMRIDRDGILVHIGAKSEGIISAREMRSLPPDDLEALNVGDEIMAYVLRSDDTGQIMLSYDRARGDRSWKVLEDKLEENVVVESNVTGFNRGGLLVNVEGIQGFVPLSQIAPHHRPQGADVEQILSDIVGSVLRLKVIEVNRRRQRAILSERVVYEAEKSDMREELIASLREGEIRKGHITGIQDFGAFVDLGGADGLVHISELSWEPIDSPTDVIKEGQEVDVYVLRIDPETRRISLSLRRAKPDPWAEMVRKYDEGQIVEATITRLTAFGAFARVEGPVEGLIHISELSESRINHPSEIVKEGDVVTLKVLRIEPERRRMGLSLRQAQAGGWASEITGAVVTTEPDVVEAAGEVVETSETSETSHTDETTDTYETNEELGASDIKETGEADAVDATLETDETDETDETSEV
tara:strand:- start:2486 stop:4027 length:1542 start_codon:yes stop_codon:yes gene_type:complete